MDMGKEGNVCSSCKSKSSKKWHPIPVSDGSHSLNQSQSQPLSQGVVCNDCSSSASDLAQLKSGEAVDASTESIGSEDIRYEVEFYSHQEEESQSNPPADFETTTDVTETDQVGQSGTTVGTKKGGKRKKGAKRGAQGQGTGAAGKGRSRRAIFKRCVSTESGLEEELSLPVESL